LLSGGQIFTKLRGGKHYNDLNTTYVNVGLTESFSASILLCNDCIGIKKIVFTISIYLPFLVKIAC
jgi:hypothetical protein